MALSAPRRASRRHFQRDTPISTVLFSSSGGGKKKFTRDTRRRDKTPEKIESRDNLTIPLKTQFFHISLSGKNTRGKKKGQHVFLEDGVLEKISSL